MKEELLINISPTESRVAVLEDGVLNEIFIERHSKLGSVGNIYLGTVVRVLPGMQAAFIDIGQSRTAFLHVNDMQGSRPKPAPKNQTSNLQDKTPSLLQKNQTATDISLDTDSKLNAIDSNTATLAMTTPSYQPPPSELIENRLHEGQRILVQVIKDQLGSKGARLTTDVSLPSRYLVYLPFGEHIGISQRIDGDERERLKTQLTELLHQVSLQGGLIARTAAENIPQPKLEEDIYYLLQLWRMVQARQQQIPSNRRFELIYQDLSLPLRAIRDLIGEQTERVTVDNARVFEGIRQFSKEFVPAIYPRIQLYEGEQALFDVHRVEDDLKDAINRRVNLKSGGYLIIDQTEAMTTIDVNTGSFVGGRSLEDTVYKTNLSDSFWGTQVGADHKLGSGWHIGGAFDYNDGNAKYDFGGKGDPKLYVGSIYGTKVFDDGQYVDIVGKIGRAENDYTVYNAEGRKLDGDYHATGYGLSVEYGKRFGTATGYVEPQIQLLFSRLGSADYDAASDFDGDKKMHVHQDSMSSFIGRLGIAAGRATEKGSLYAKASILHEFKGDTAATFSAEGEDTSRVEQDFGDTWAELTLGGVYRLNGSNLFYANVTRGFGGDYKVEWKVNAGLRFAF